MEKRAVILLSLFLVLSLVFLLTSVSAELEIEKEPVIDVVVPEINQPAVYDLKITNLGDFDFFSIYSLVGVDILPNETFFIKKDETKKIRVELWPQQSVLDKPGTFNFVYKIKSKDGEMQDDVLLIRVVSLKDTLKINSYNIDFDSDKAVVYVKNRVSLGFPKIKAHFTSSFFDFSEEFSLDKYEKKEFEVPLNRAEMKQLAAGSYIITTDIETYGAKERIDDSFRYTEKQEISSEESKKGILVSQIIVKKINEGNLPSLVQVRVKKNIISRLFTTMNVEPAKTEREGFTVNYVFQKEIGPAEIYTVKVTTNWFYPLILLFAVVLVGYLVRAYTTTFILLRKRITFVKTKGGEFALKIVLIAKAKNFVEKIKIIDKIPSLVKVHKRFGAAEPDKIDEKNRRLEWNIENLQPHEERVFSYIIYSKISPIGKFEIPRATAVFEKEGKVHEASSNKVFFMSEPRGK